MRLFPLVALFLTACPTPAWDIARDGLAESPQAVEKNVYYHSSYGFLRRICDPEAKVVCYTHGHGVDCLPMAETALESCDG